MSFQEKLKSGVLSLTAWGFARVGFCLMGFCQGGVLSDGVLSG